MLTIDQLILHASVVTPPNARGPVYGRRMNDLTIEHDAGVAIHEKRMIEVDSSKILLTRFRAKHVFDAGGKVVTPGLVDAHTHLVFAGDRVHEFEMKIQGATYQEIASKGGGILSTVHATRAASSPSLIRLAMERLNRLLAHGVTTVEVKSGYGLSWEAELKMLNVIRQLQMRHPLDLVTTFLGAHAVPQEYRGRRAAFVSLIADRLIPHVAKHRLAEFCDVFCDVGAFTVNETRQMFEAATQSGLSLKLHAHEFSQNGGVPLAGRYQAVSADHLLQMSSSDIQSMNEHHVVPVVLPGTPFGLGLKSYAPARKMIEAGLPVALGSDCNPGTSYSENFPLMMTLACTQMRMTPAEALTAATINAAAAIGRAHKVGTLQRYKQADLVVWNTTDYRHLTYHYGVNLVEAVIKKGKWILNRSQESEVRSQKKR